MKKFKKIERLRLSDNIANNIEEAIISGEFVSGSRLLPEQVLADQFGTSRNMVREAFKILIGRGLIRIINGIGAVVCEPSLDTTIDALGRYLQLLGREDQIDAFFETRKFLEGNNARLASERADKQDIKVLSECIEKLQQSKNSIEKWAENDLEFHLVIAKATHNIFFSILLQPLIVQLRKVIKVGKVITTDIPEDSMYNDTEIHIEIFNCIKNGDPEGAYNAMIKHISGAEQMQRKYRK